MRTVTLYFLCLSALILLLIGCGGGEGGSSASTSMTLRQVQPGDSFTFHVVDVGGVDDVWDEVWTYSYNASLGKLENSNVNWDQFMFLDYTDDTCDVYEGTTGDVSAQLFSFASTMQAGQDVDASAYYDTLILEGPFTLTVPAGVFQVYKFSNFEDGGGYSSYWISPELGMLVKYYMYDGGGTQIVTRELTAYQLTD